MNRLDTECCIVGAGFAGLSAAHKLAKAGRSFVVLEARKRVGGRVYTEHLEDGTPINFGGAWIGEGHTQLYGLVKEMGAATYPQYEAGDHLMLLAGKVHRYSRGMPRMNPLVLGSVGIALQRMQRMSRRVPLEAPWEADQARDWDSQTLGSWIDSRWNVPSSTARTMVRAIWDGIVMTDSSEVSLLHALHLNHSLQSVEWILGNKGGAQQDLVVGGMQTLANGVATTLGEALRLESPVRRIAQTADEIEIEADGVTVRARRAIVATPLMLAGRIAYDPVLPLLRRQLMDRAPLGEVVRCYAIYDQPFWRTDGLSGETSALDMPVRLSLDVTPPAGTPGVITAFVMGPDARRLAAQSKEERRRVFLDGLVARFGQKAASPVYFDDYDWTADEWTRGAMFAHFAPGVLTGFGRALREPCGRIHWAGTETATLWSGSIEGAIRSGQRAADEILAARA